MYIKYPCAYRPQGDAELMGEKCTKRHRKMCESSKKEDQDLQGANHNCVLPLTDLKCFFIHERHCTNEVYISTAIMILNISVYSKLTFGMLAMVEQQKHTSVHNSTTNDDRTKFWLRNKYAACGLIISRQYQSAICLQWRKQFYKLSNCCIYCHLQNI